MIFSPAAASARSADSRPAPGPFTITVTFFRPCSMALAAASPAATCAANGVDLRLPLKPRAPADDQEITFPETSVMVMMRVVEGGLDVDHAVEDVLLALPLEPSSAPARLGAAGAPAAAAAAGCVRLFSHVLGLLVQVIDAGRAAQALGEWFARRGGRLGAG